MKKHLIKTIIFSIFVFIFAMPSIKATCGDLVYDILDMKITDKNITIDGWAFIHLTQNGYDLSGNNTNQKIKINLCNAGETKCYYSSGEGEINGSGFNFTEVMKYNNELEYYYKNIGFKATFDTNKIANIFNSEGEQTLHFTISVTNDDYNARHSSCSGTSIFNKMVGTTQIRENSKYWVKENLKILKNTITGNANNETIEIKATGTDKLLYTGWHTISGEKDGSTINIGWGQIYKYEGKNGQPKYSSNSSDTNPGTYKITTKITKDKFFSLSDVGWRYYTCANYDENGNPNNNYLNIREYQQGAGNGTLGFCESINSSYQCIGNTINPITSATYACGETRTFNKSITFAKIYGETSIKIKVKNDKKCEVSEPSSSKTMNCNNWKDLSSTCNELTVRNNGSTANVKIEQKGYISNIFKSNLVNEDNNYDANSYNGGWLKYGITYYNEVSWNFANIRMYTSKEQKDVTDAMQKKIKQLSDFEDNINLTIVGLDDSRLVKKCTESGSFTSSNKLITSCTFFLPESYLKELTGIVNYSESNNNTNINNKYYIPLDSQKHNVSVKLENLSRLSDSVAKQDSKNKNKTWFGTWTIDTSCSLKVTDRIYETSNKGKENGKIKYKFTYRPISLNNPFPNRFPGVNWYTWYITEKNKDKKTLEDSYKKLNYYTELDNKTISEIKEYNNNNSYFNKVDNDFFKNYIKEGGTP